MYLKAAIHNLESIEIYCNIVSPVKCSVKWDRNNMVSLLMNEQKSEFLLYYLSIHWNEART